MTKDDDVHSYGRTDEGKPIYNEWSKNLGREIQNKYLTGSIKDSKNWLSYAVSQLEKEKGIKPNSFRSFIGPNL